MNIIYFLYMATLWYHSHLMLSWSLYFILWYHGHFTLFMFPRPPFLISVWPPFIFSWPFYWYFNATGFYSLTIIFFNLYFHSRLSYIHVSIAAFLIFMFPWPPFLYSCFHGLPFLHVLDHIYLKVAKRKLIINRWKGSF